MGGFCLASDNEPMKRSANRILTTHAGSLARPADLIARYREQAPPDFNFVNAVMGSSKDRADLGEFQTGEAGFAHPGCGADETERRAFLAPYFLDRDSSGLIRS